MAEIPMGDTSGCPPTFSLFPPFLPTIIKQRLTSSRYALARPEPTPSTTPREDTMPFNINTLTGTSTPRPSSSGSTSTARNSEDLFGEEDTRNANKDVVAIGVSGNSEVDIGLRWNRVIPALNLLRYANYEAQQPNCESRFVRSLYLDSIAYLLSALPEDLSSDETLNLRRSLPEKLKPAFTPDTGMDIGGSPDLHTHAAAPYPPHRSYLHRLLAASIIYFCILLQYIMPYMKDVLIHLYRYDRTHKVSERVTVAALYVAEKIGRGSVNLGNSVLNMYDGKTGSAISGAAGWWIEGVAGGIYEGLGEGMAILGVAVGPMGVGKAGSNGG